MALPVRAAGQEGPPDTNQYAAKILARHWPEVPNLGDVTAIDWQAVLEAHGPIDILTGGFPCQDVSSAGKRAGLTADSRSGLWAHFARAIHELNPRLVVIENVEGLLSAPADRGLGLDAEALEEEARAGRILRALGAVLGDLATLGFHAEWERVGADEVGAPHRRRRVIVYAWPAALDPRCFGWRDGQGFVGGLGVAGRGPETPADAAHLGHERGWHARGRGHGPEDGGIAAADASRPGPKVGGVEPDRHEFPAAERGRRESPADTHSVYAERRGVAGVLGSQAETEPREGDQRERAGHTAGDSGEAAADTKGDGWDEGRPEPARQQGRPDVAQRSGATPSDADHSGRREDVLNLRPGQPDLDWGDYGPAIRRWERILGRPAPWPTDVLGRLSPVFTEWLMGLPDGWVTDTPGLTRPAMLRALGNGVVWQQAVAAIRILHARAIEDDRAAAA